jgi:hypothetical protein
LAAFFEASCLSAIDKAFFRPTGEEASGDLGVGMDITLED